jgi:hypothetical protein
MLYTLGNVGDSTGNFAGYKCITPAGRFMVKKNAIASVNPIRLTIVNRYPVGIHLCHPEGGPSQAGIIFCLIFDQTVYPL